MENSPNVEKIPINMSEALEEICTIIKNVYRIYSISIDKIKFKKFIDDNPEDSYIFNHDGKRIFYFSNKLLEEEVYNAKIFILEKCLFEIKSNEESNDEDLDYDY